MEKTTIYGLYSTRDNIIRYVGKSNNPKSRLKDHIWSSKAKINNTYKSCWIRKELNDGFNILYKVLEVCDMESWTEIEQKYIKNTDNLTNHHKGGLGGSPIQYDKTYKELKDWVNINLPEGINTAKKWKEYVKLNYKNILPLTPNKIYKDLGWISWAEFLSSNFHRKIKYITYNEFKTWLVVNNINSYTQFRKINKPTGVPSHPERIYKDEWLGWVAIISKSRNYNKNVYWSYEKSKEYLNSKYGNLTVLEFRELCKNNELPYHIPKKPERVFINFIYKEFLNLNHVPYLDYEKAKEIVHAFNIKTNREWRVFIKENKLPLNIPRNPELVYKNEWISWTEWLGSDNVANKLKWFYTYNEFKKIINELNIKSFSEFKKYITNNKSDNKSNVKIPTNPSKFYKNKGWISWYDLFN
jgi:hypothetical protein